MESKRKLIERIKGGLIVSCNPNYRDDCIIHMVKAAIWGGADMIATTLCRFNKNYKSTSKPDFELLCRLIRLCNEKKVGKVILESKISTSEEAIISLYHGAYSLVVGNAITRPHITTQKLCDAINAYKEKRSLFYWGNR
ncbi:hypothetical protein [Clostridium paraputrificum]|uniref:N-acylglucosamine-6-phosphate 2-epimerase n=1 Tax=Clostridium paraputrificum TaxID=29363 RepID=A0A6N2ZNL2_9CLOT